MKMKMKEEEEAVKYSNSAKVHWVFPLSQTGMRLWYGRKINQYT